MNLNQEIIEKVIELNKILTKNSSPPSSLTLQIISRLIRPINHQITSYNQIIQRRIKDLLLSFYSLKLNGNEVIINYEKEINFLYQNNSKILSLFLMLLLPLSFASSSSSSSSSSISSSSELRSGDRNDSNQNYNKIETIYFNSLETQTQRQRQLPSQLSTTTETTTNKKQEKKTLNLTNLPIGIPPPLNEEELTLLTDTTLWITRDIETLLLRDLLLIFQVNLLFYLLSLSFLLLLSLLS